MAQEIRAAHILVSDEAKARALMDKLKGGASFAELAKEHSQCPSGRRGGDLGWFSRGQMVAEFERAAFGGSKGSVVGPIQTQFGWHLIHIIDER